MIGWSTFGRSAVFGAAAALAWLPWLFLSGPFVGGRGALTLYLIGALALYVVGLGRRRGRGMVVALGIVPAASAVGVVAGSITELCIGLAAILGVARSGFLYRRAPARAAAIEVGLLIAGLLLARLVAGPAPVSIPLAIWAFLLVQSAFFLIAGGRDRAAEVAQVDPFDEAHRRATAILDRGGV